MSYYKFANVREERKIKSDLTRCFENLDPPYIALLTTRAQEYHIVSKELTKFMIVEKGIPGVYVTINEPYSVIKDSFNEYLLRFTIFIDAITKSVGRKAEKVDGCLFLGSPENLTDISVAIAEATNSILCKEKFIIFDSMSTLLLYNNADTVARFANFLTCKMRMLGVEGVLLHVEDGTDDQMVSQLSQFCDTVLKIGGK